MPAYLDMITEVSFTTTANFLYQFFVFKGKTCQTTKYYLQPSYSVCTLISLQDLVSWIGRKLKDMYTYIGYMTHAHW